MLALPFGTVRSVHAFLRVSASLWFLLVKDFLVLTTDYFDDFVTLAESVEAPSVTACVHMFFKLVGWAFAAEGPKAPEFSELFNALGVTINVSRLHEGLVTLGNTESRRAELIKSLCEILACKKLTEPTICSWQRFRPCGQKCTWGSVSPCIRRWNVVA